MHAHFTPESFRFLADLEANNSKDWFETNRARYERHLKAPALDLIEELAPRLGDLDPPLKAEPRINGSLRRINRDVRFSKDKSPYNASLHLIFWAGDHPNRSPGLHVVLRPRGVGYGTGLYGLGPEQLVRYRDMVADPVEFRALEAALAAAEADGCTLGAPDLARLPKGYDADGRQAELLRYKSLVARTHGTQAPPEAVAGPDAAEWILDRATALLPLIRWLSVV
jgi:uncharacterized protein (TIGR02453 family)